VTDPGVALYRLVGPFAFDDGSFQKRDKFLELGIMRVRLNDIERRSSNYIFESGQLNSLNPPEAYR
jgi:hypothetical protein